MSPLTIEIHGTGTYNRGAELMAISIAERMRASFPGVRIVVPPEFGPFEARARYGFLTTWEFAGRFRTRTIARLMPKAVMQAAGIIHPKEVDVVLDASGFAFSDQWGVGPARALIDKLEHPNRRTQKLILLPQAFGPFTNVEVAETTRRLTKRASLVCARDEQSLMQLRTLLDLPTYRLFPDFTINLESVSAASVVLPKNFVAIVPNKRMLDKGSSGEAYLHFLRHAIESFRSRQMNPAFVLHDAIEDREVISVLQRDGAKLPVIEHKDPRVLKWILGRAILVLGSRFHALVSALSQGVPCIGTGWSHKYPELFASFDCLDFLIQDLTKLNEIDSLLNRLKSLDQANPKSPTILAAAGRLKERNKMMWYEVEAIIHPKQKGLKQIL